MNGMVRSCIVIPFHVMKSESMMLSAKNTDTDTTVYA